MAGMTVGAGLAALGFWIFIAAVAVTAIWVGARRRETQQEILCRMAESGQAVDGSVARRLLAEGGRRLERDLKAAGLVLLFAAPGLAILGWFISLGAAEWLYPLLGLAALTGCFGLGFLVASIVVGRWYRRDGESAAKAGRHQVGFGGV